LTRIVGTLIGITASFRREDATIGISQEGAAVVNLGNVRAAFAAALVLLAIVPDASAQVRGGLQLKGQWFRFIMSSLPAAGYFTLQNRSPTAKRLTGASSPACGMLMLHKSVRKNGTESMVMVPSVAVPGHGSVRFAPGGYHLMCMNPATAMRPGKTVPVTLKFAGGATLTAPFPVRNATGK
jgi:periplasmic copper chaperone A